MASIGTSRKEQNAGIIQKQFVRANGKIISIVDLHKIEVGDYQRELSPRHVADIKANFLRYAQNPPTVSLRDSRMWVVDGNHTLKNMIDAGMTIGEVEVVLGLTYEQEAELFFKMNNTKKRMTPTVSFLSAIKAGMAKETTIFNILQECKVNSTITDKKEADIRSYSILYKAFELAHGSPTLLTHFLKCLKRTWRISAKNPRIQAEARNIQFQRGLLDFLVKHPKVKANEFVKIFKNHSASEIQSLALEITAESGTARADCRQVREALEYIYSTSNNLMNKKTKQGKTSNKLNKLNKVLA